MTGAGRDGLTFDGTDHKGLKGLLWAAALVVLVLEVLAPVVAGIAGEPVHARVRTNVALGGLAPGVTVDNPSQVLVAIADPTLAQRVLVSLPGALVAVAVLLVVRLLLGLLGDLRDEPFTMENVRRLRGVAVVVGMGAVIVSLAQAVCDLVLSDRALLGQDESWVFELSLPFGYLAVMLVVAAIAEAFRHGVRLRDDVEGLV